MTAGAEAFDDVLRANALLATRTGDSVLLPAGAGKGLAVLTCIDSRVDPTAVLGLSLGDALVFRNPGGQLTSEALAGLVLAVHELGATRILVMQHTHCAMTRLEVESMRERVATASGADPASLEWLPIPDQYEKLAADVSSLRDSAFIPADVAVLGAVFDLDTGRLYQL